MPSRATPPGALPTRHTQRRIRACIKLGPRREPTEDLEAKFSADISRSVTFCAGLSPDLVPDACGYGRPIEPLRTGGSSGKCNQSQLGEKIQYAEVGLAHCRGGAQRPADTRHRACRHREARGGTRQSRRALLRHGFLALALQAARFPPLRIMLKSRVWVTIMSCRDVAGFARCRELARCCELARRGVHERGFEGTLGGRLNETASGRRR